MDFYIDSTFTSEASFEFFLDEYIHIKSITFKSISFYNSWWTGDIQQGDLLLMYMKSEGRKIPSVIQEGHYSISDVCSFFNNMLKLGKVNHVKMHCDQNNYLIIELTEEREFNLIEMFKPGTSSFLNNNWFGFKQTKFTKKGKYYSTQPLLFYRTDMFLRSNLVKQQNILYNNKPSNILCIIPVEDGDQIKHQTYKPNDCCKIIDRTTNNIKVEITDKDGNVINFRGRRLVIHLQLNYEQNRVNGFQH